MKNVFSLNSFAFSFDGKKQFFQESSFSISKPGLIFVLGKNGSGKSTFFRLLQGIVNSTEDVQGNLVLQDQRYNLGNAADRAMLYESSSILHQNFDSMIAPSFTGLQNLQYSTFDQNPGFSLVSSLYHASSIEESFSIPLNKPAYQLSGGQRQMLAMLMITKKKLNLLLLDEPTAALDTKNSEYVMQKVKELSQVRKVTVLCVSHDQDLVNAYADSRIVIYQKNDGQRGIILES